MYVSDMQQNPVCLQTEQGKRATAWEEMMVTNSAAIKTERASASKR